MAATLDARARRVRFCLVSRLSISRVCARAVRGLCGLSLCTCSYMREYTPRARKQRLPAFCPPPLCRAIAPAAPCC